MKLRELFEARSLSNENSNGRPIAHTAEALKNFWTWFKGSKVVDEQKRPLVMYHGTGADIAQFGYEYADKGSSAYGMGFYFTNMPNTASGYAMGDTPNVVPVYLNIKKPMISNYARLLNRAQIKRFIMASPILDDALSNFGDVEYEGKTRLINSIVDQFDDCCDSLLQQLNLLANDFYRDQNEAFMRTAIAITGFDGVKHAFESGEVFFIAWNANQIKSAVGARGYQGSDLITESIPMMEFLEPKKPKTIKSSILKKSGVQGSIINYNVRQFNTSSGNNVKVRFQNKLTDTGEKSTDIVFFVNDTTYDNASTNDKDIDNDFEILSGVMYIILKYLDNNKINHVSFEAASGSGDNKLKFNLPVNKTITNLLSAINNFESMLKRFIITPEMLKKERDRQHALYNKLNKPIPEKVVVIYKEELLSAIKQLKQFIHNLKPNEDSYSKFNDIINKIQKYKVRVDNFQEYITLMDYLTDLGNQLKSYTQYGVQINKNRRLSIYTKLLDKYFSNKWDIKNHGNTFELTRKKQNDSITEKFGDDWDTIHVDGGHIQIWPNAPHAPRSASVIDFVVDADKRNQGIGDKLVKAAMHKYHDLGAQVSSLASLKVFYNNGFRNPRIPETSFHDHIEAFHDNGGSLFMARNDDTGKSYISENYDEELTEDDLYEMSNFLSKYTGLPSNIIVWVRTDPMNHGHNRYRIKITKDKEWAAIYTVGQSPTMVKNINYSITLKENGIILDWIKNVSSILISLIDGKIDTVDAATEFAKLNEGLPNAGQFVIDPGFDKFYNDDDEDLGRELVKINVPAFDAAWRNGSSGNQYIGAEGHGGIKGRYEKFGKWLATANQPIEASTVGVDDDGSVSFYNGRHRYCYLRDHGVKRIMVAMDPYSIKNAKKYKLI